MDLTDRFVLVTGARRIGADVAVALAARGAHVAVTYNRSRDEAEETAERVRSLGRRGRALRADLSQPAGCRQLVAHVAAEFGGIDVLVNMASTYVQREFDSLTDEQWQCDLAVDLGATFSCSHAAVPHMRQRGGGRIVNFTDWTAASRRPRYSGYVAYYVAKAGVIALTEALALELAPDGILVNAVAPGPILAPPELSEEERDAVERATPLGRWGGEGEIVKAVQALVETDFITGETVRVDGGRHLR